MKVYGYSPFGYEGALVTVETDLRHGIPAVDIVGLADGSVKESRERMKAAIKNSGFEFPQERVLISLVPADLRKEGAGFDLAMAMAVLYAQNPVAHATDSLLCYAELELSGRLRPVRGTYAALESALSHGITKAIVPVSVPDAEIPDGITVCRAITLGEAWHIATSADGGTAPKAPARPAECGIEFPVTFEEGTIDDIKKPELVRAMMIAAAGRHHLLAVGMPGCGKTLALQHFSELLPALTNEEMQSVKRIHSIAGLMSGDETKSVIPPFRQPHQTASLEGMCGGGPNCRPGEISLAHNGVLFLDEAAEFRSSVLQMLRVPLETGAISLSRAGRTAVYPAKFQLLMATNPCPCGNYGSSERICLCSSKSVEQYWNKFSAPLLDRIAIRIYVKSSDESHIEQLSLAQMREKIAKATEKQRKRGAYNQKLTPYEINEFCTLTDRAKAVFEGLKDISEREKSNVLKVARTIADLDEVEKIESGHIEEAARLATWKLDY